MKSAISILLSFILCCSTLIAQDSEEQVLLYQIRTALAELQRTNQLNKAEIYQQLKAFHRETSNSLKQADLRLTEDAFRQTESLNNALATLVDLSKDDGAFPTCQHYFQHAQERFSSDVRIENGNPFYEVLKAYRAVCSDPNWLWEQNDLVRFEVYNSLTKGSALVESEMQNAADLCAPVYAGYYVVHGAYLDSMAAHALIKELETELEFSVTTFRFRHIDGQALQMVLIGTFGSLDIAQEALFALQARRHAGAYIIDFKNESFSPCEYPG